jgi:hypothetical protein
LSSSPAALGDSPLYEPLRSIGFSEARIRQILARFKRHQIELWSEVTLAKIERDGGESFTNCPEAYFTDNIKAASQAKRTAPDWYVQDRKAKNLARREEERHQGEETISFAQYQAARQIARSQAFKKYDEAEIGRDEYKRAVGTLSDVFSHTMPANEAVDRAIRDVERHFMSGFRFPDIATWVMEHKDELDTAA